MGKPAARVGDSVVHPIPPVLTGVGCPTVLIGNMPAWRGVGAAMVPGIQAMAKTTDIAIKALEATTAAAPDPISKAAAKTAEELGKATAAIANSATMMAMAGMGDIHTCGTPLPIPPHGPGLVIDGSKTVFIGGSPAAMMGCTVQEAIGPPNKIVSGCFTVLIG